MARLQENSRILLTGFPALAIHSCRIFQMFQPAFNVNGNMDTADQFEREEMNLRCSLYCDECDYFKKALQVAGLELGPHPADTTFLESFKDVFYPLISRHNVRQLFKVLREEDSEVPEGSKELYLNGTFYEFRTAGLMIKNSFSVVGMLSMASNFLNADIYLVTSRQTLRRLKGQKKVLKFSFGDGEQRTKYVVGYIGMGFFHSLIQPSDFEAVDASCKIVNEAIIRIERPPQRINQITIVPETPRFLVPDDEMAAAEGDENFEATDEEILEWSLSEFIQKLIIDPKRALTENCKVSVERSAEDDQQIASPTEICRSFDIDGFFGHCTAGDCFKLFNGSVALKKESFHPSLLKTIGARFSEDARPFILGNFAANFGNVKFIYVRRDFDTISSETFTRTCNKAFSKALEAKCIGDDGEIFHSNCSDPLRLNVNACRSLQRKDEILLASPSRFNCFLYFFKLELARILGPPVEDFIYFHGIGFKHTTNVADKNELCQSLQGFGEAFNLPKISCSFDIAVSIVAVPSEGSHFTLFWKKEAFDRIGRFLGPGHKYPLLFCGDFANYHSNEQHEFVEKRNFYSCLVDKLQKANNCPLRFFNVAKRLASLATTETGSKFLSKARADLQSFEREVSDLMAACTRYSQEDGQLRAEIRVQYGNVSSFVQLLDDFAADIENFWVFRSETISNLCGKYVNAMASLIVKDSKAYVEKIDSLCFNQQLELLGTISSLESLLAFSLFSGNTYSYASKLVWSRDFGNLRWFINAQNKLTLNSVWKPDELVFDFNLLENPAFLRGMIAKIMNSPLSQQFLLVGELTDLLKQQPRNDREIAQALWRCYFDCLPSSLFIPGSQITRWKVNSCSQRVILRTEPKRAIEAVQSIFDEANLKQPSWNLSFLLGFSMWRRRVSVELAYQYLEASITGLGIEMILDHSRNGPFVERESVVFWPIAEIGIDAEDDNELHSSNLLATGLLKRPRASRQFYTDFDRTQLLKGINTYGLGHWAKIVADERFKVPRHCKNPNISLKDLFRTTEKRPNFRREPFYHLDGLKDECQALPTRQDEGVNSFTNPSNTARHEFSEEE